MDLFYPYNEILPKKKAHDVFIVHECHALASLGLRVTLACGAGTLEDEAFHTHYQTSQIFDIKRLKIVRKNNPLRLTWNRPFFWQAQQHIEEKRPEWVFLSVRKQGAYHLERRVPGVRYLYEVHELEHYPGQPIDAKRLTFERTMLSRADLITVPVETLKDILLAPPYALNVPIEVVPLAVQAKPLSQPPPDGPLTVFYVGQLYEGQGISLLLQALAMTPDLSLKILGGRPAEIEPLKSYASSLGVANRVHFLGFLPPGDLALHVQEADAFVAPFEATGRMPFVAHTKLVEYASWGRPTVAPDLPVVREHLPDLSLLFTPGSAPSLAQALSRLQKGRSVPSRPSSWQVRAERCHALLISKRNPS